MTRDKVTEKKRCCESNVNCVGVRLAQRSTVQRQPAIFRQKATEKGRTVAI
jgi:hypothetical protein